MPTYEYQCTRCQHRFEIIHGMSERPKLACPECGSLVQKLAGIGSGIIFSDRFREPAPPSDPHATCHHDHDHDHAHHDHPEGFPCYWDRELDFSHIDEDGDEGKA